MRATVIHGAGDIRLEDVPDPAIQRPTDAVVRVVAACVCGSDLWSYRGVEPTEHPHRIGHEFVGVVEAVGSDVTSVLPGDFVIAPFSISDGTCVHCRNGITTSCLHGGWWGAPDRDGLPVDAAQGEYVRVPHADGTLVATPEAPDPELIPDLLTLSDVMATGHHAARCAGVRAGSTVAVVGDGAVGLCGVLAARRLGAERIAVFSRHPARQELARSFGATDVVTERGDEGVAALTELLDGIGADAVLECVGTAESMAQAIGSARPGGTVGYVGLPIGGAKPSLGRMFIRNVNLAGGVAPARTYLPDLLRAVLQNEIRPGAVFDLTLPLAEVAQAYAAMDQRQAIKVMLRP